MEEIKVALQTEIVDCIEALGETSVTTPEYLNGSKAVSELISKHIELVQLENDIQESKDRIELERWIQENNSRIEVAKILTDCLQTGLRFAGMGLLTITTFKFEEQGVLRAKAWSWIPQLWKEKN